ncbi:MAG: hypothetical protein D6160_04485 [Ketobacter sp.]|nr:MAG: hypothetical protein D6160_04485 [Ketobacter sp.]
MVEYMVVTLTLMASLWWAFMGDTGYWGTNDSEEYDGGLMMYTTETQKSAPSVINALNDKQHKFAQDVYQP